MKKHRFLAFILAGLLVLVGLVYAGSLTTTYAPGLIVVSDLQSDWYQATDTSVSTQQGINLVAVAFISTATSDVVEVRNITTNGTVIFRGTDANPIWYYPGNSAYHPVIDVSAGTFSNATNASVMFFYK